LFGGRGGRKPIFLTIFKTRFFTPLEFSLLITGNFTVLISGSLGKGYLPPNKKRHEIPLDHGFRKYFNTMMRRAKVNYLDKEDMMGHSVGLERHYERYQEEDFERFPEYQKAISFLTIDPTERQRLKIHQLEDEKTLFAEKEKEIENLKTNIEQMVEEKVNEYNQKLMKELGNMYDAKRIEFMKKEQKKDEELLKKLYSNQ